jgi:hypothetical protein
VTSLDPRRALKWEGVLVSPRLFRGRHTFTLEAQADNTTMLVNDEAFDGLLTTLTAPVLRHAPAQRTGYDAFNQTLKARVEYLAMNQLGEVLHG